MYKTNDDSGGGGGNSLSLRTYCLLYNAFIFICVGIYIDRQRKTEK